MLLIKREKEICIPFSKVKELEEAEARMKELHTPFTPISIWIEERKSSLTLVQKIEYHMRTFECNSARLIDKGAKALEKKLDGRVDLNKILTAGVIITDAILLGCLAVMAYSAFAVGPAAIYAVNLDGLDTIGNKILDVARGIGYWVATISAITKVIQSAMQGSDKNDVLKIIMKYCIIYGALFAIPELFDLIKESMVPATP